MKDGNGRLKSFANILDNIIIIALKYCKDKFILRGEAYELMNGSDIMRS